MGAPFRLDDIDLGPEKRRIEFQSQSIGYPIAAAVMSVLSCGGGIAAIFFPRRAGPGETDHITTVLILAFGLAGLLLLCALGLAALRIYSMNERILVFADGICWEHWSTQECYRWKDIDKIVWYSNDDGVYWLYMKSGRKIVVSVLGGVPPKAWRSLRKLLEKKVPNKFVDES